MQLGNLPRKEAKTITELLKNGADLEAVTLWEWVNRSQRDTRCGVQLVIAPRERAKIVRPEV